MLVKGRKYDRMREMSEIEREKKTHRGKQKPADDIKCNRERK